MKYIVLELNQDEFGQGISRPVHQFDSMEQLIRFVSSYRGDTLRLEIFEAKQLDLEINIRYKD